MKADEGKFMAQMWACMYVNQNRKRIKKGGEGTSCAHLCVRHLTSVVSVIFRATLK